MFESLISIFLISFGAILGANFRMELMRQFENRIDKGGARKRK